MVDTFGMNESEYAVLNSKDDINTYILKIIYDKQRKYDFGGIDDEELQDAIEVYEELKEEKKRLWI